MMSERVANVSAGKHLLNLPLVANKRVNGGVGKDGMEALDHSLRSPQVNEAVMNDCNLALSPGS